MQIRDEFKRSEFLVYLVRIALGLDQMQIAETYAREVTETEARTRIVCDIAARHALLDNFALALQKIAALSAPEDRFRGYFQIISANPENRNFRAKLSLLAEISANIGLIRRTAEADHILAECAIQLARLEKFHLALQVQETVSSDTERDELLWNLAELKFRSDFFVEGIEIIRLIRDQNRRISRLIQLGVAIHKGVYAAATFSVSDFCQSLFRSGLKKRKNWKF
jgi:hypothetical protein